MPRRTSLDASTWNKVHASERMVPSLWEFCLEVLVAGNSTKFDQLKLEQQKKLACTFMQKEKITRESLLFFSSSSSISACVHLDLSSSAITDHGLYILSGITSIQKLQLHHCKNITNSGISYLRTLSQLEYLDISKCRNISDDGLPYLSYLTNLLTLEINDILSLGKGLVSALRHLSKLSSLSIARSRFVASLLPELHSCLPSLTSLNLKDIKTITDESIVPLTCFPSLSSLDISGTMISTRGQHVLQGLLMGRDDIIKVQIRSPLLVEIQIRGEQCFTAPQTDKQLSKIETLFNSKELAQYITNLVTVSSSSTALRRSFGKLAVQAKETASYKEGLPEVKVPHVITERQRNVTPLPHGMVASNSQFSFPIDTESESDSDEILLVLSDTEDEEEDKDPSSLFLFDEQDNLPELQIRIGEIPNIPQLTHPIAVIPRKEKKKMPSGKENRKEKRPPMLRSNSVGSKALQPRKGNTTTSTKTRKRTNSVGITKRTKPGNSFSPQLSPRTYNTRAKRQSLIPTRARSTRSDPKTKKRKKSLSRMFREIGLDE